MKTEARQEMKGHRWFAATYDFLNRSSERKVLGQLRPLVAGVASGEVLEIGAGTGANFPFYDRSKIRRIVAVEPDPFMLRRAKRRAQELGLAVEFHQCAAEALPFPDALFDTVVATLVFCTVQDPARAFAEVKRVLKPAGAFRFIEHVRADRPLAGKVQDLVTPVWRRIGAGCHPNRRTVESIVAAGFQIVALQRKDMGFLPLIVGEARPVDPVGSR